jgi:hypothetical protein
MSSWDQANRGENLVWFGEIERKVAKLSMTTLTYRSSSLLFYGSVCHAAGETCDERDRRSSGSVQAQDIPAHRRGEFIELR